MAAPLKLEQMGGSKPECLFCGMKPRDEDDKPYPGVTAEGVDINWGDTPYVCYGCVMVAGELFGMIKPELAEKLHAQLKFRTKQVEKLQKELDEVNERVKKMLEGSRAAKEARKAVKDGK